VVNFTGTGEIASFDLAHINGFYLWPGPKLAKAAERAGD
jgi:hypothetical protein